jgi:hypothetical protein
VPLPPLRVWVLDADPTRPQLDDPVSELPVCVVVLVPATLRVPVYVPRPSLPASGVVLDTVSVEVCVVFKQHSLW